MLRDPKVGGGNNEHCNKIVFIHHVLARQKVSVSFGVRIPCTRVHILTKY